MKHLKTYEQYSDTLILEKIDFKNMLNKLKKSDMKKKKRIAKIVIIGLLSVYTFSQASQIIDKQDIPITDKEFLQTELDSISSAKDSIASAKEDSLARYKDPTTLILSQEGWDQLRIEEGSIYNKGEPVLKAYKLGDGMITIGYGHAERISNSTYKVGDTITKEKAEELFIIDVNEAATGVKRMFKQWKEDGIDVKLTQEQYDVCVSIAFNKGVQGFRNSAFVQEIKNGDMIAAAEKIKAEADTARYEGVKKRRIRESEKFLT